MTDTSAAGTTQTTQSADVTTTTIAAPAPFYAGFSDPDLKGYIETKGFKEPQDLALSYKNLEKLVGVPADQVLKLPKEDDKEGWNKVHERLGRPAKPEEYGLEAIEGSDAEYAKFISTAMHELGITKKQAVAIAQKQNEFIKANQSKQTETYQNQIKEQDTALRSEWGQAYDKNVQIARGSFAELGIDTATVDALEKAIGFSGVMEFFHNIGSKIGEDKFVSANSANNFGNVMSPDAARARISAIKNDPVLSRKYATGDADLRAEMDRLHSMLFSAA